MPAEPMACGWQGTREQGPTSSGQPCPVCRGGLVPLRGQWRCTRCGYLLCAGCEPDYPVNSAEETPN